MSILGSHYKVNRIYYGFYLQLLSPQQYHHGELFAFYLGMALQVDLCDHFNVCDGSYRSTLLEIYLAEIDKQFDEGASTNRYITNSQVFISFVTFANYCTSSYP